MPFGRKRGAQPKNRNAVTHGFYLGAMAPGSRKVLRRAMRLDPHELEHEIALVRSRIYALVEKKPDNITVLVLAGRLLVKMIAVHYGLSAEHENAIHESLRTLISDLSPREGHTPWIAPASTTSSPAPS